MVSRTSILFPDAGGVAVDNAVLDTAQVCIRPADSGDMEAMVHLLKSLFSIEADFNFNAKKQRCGLSLMLRGDGAHRHVAVAEVAGRVIGMCSAQMLVSTAEGAQTAVVEDLVVLDGCRGVGVGGMLLAHIENWVRRRGGVRLQLLADRGNVAAIDFYRKHGWEWTRLIGLRKMPFSRKRKGGGDGA